MPIELLPYDSVGFFRDNPEFQDELLADAVEQAHAGYLAHALSIIARARGLTDMPEKTGMTLETLLKMLDTLDLQLKIEPIAPKCSKSAMADA